MEYLIMGLLTWEPLVYHTLKVKINGEQLQKVFTCSREFGLSS